METLYRPSYSNRSRNYCIDPSAQLFHQFVASYRSLCGVCMEPCLSSGRSSIDWAIARWARHDARRVRSSDYCPAMCLIGRMVLASLIDPWCIADASSYLDQGFDSNHLKQWELAVWNLNDTASGTMNLATEQCSSTERATQGKAHHKRRLALWASIPLPHTSSWFANWH